MADKRDEELEILRQMLMRHDDDIVRHDDGIDVLRQNVKKHDEEISVLKELLAKHDNQFAILLQTAVMQLETTTAQTEQIKLLNEKSAHLDESLGVLIKMMDEWIRVNKKDNGAV